MRRVLLIALCGCLCASIAEAQGHRGAPPGQLKKKDAGPAAGAFADPAGDVVTGSPRVRSFGVWLDDATLAAPRSLWVTIGVTRWSAPAGSGVEAPAFGVAAGITPRAQVSFSVSHSRATLEGYEPELSEIGNLYAGVKLLLREPTNDAIGVSISPTLEVLGPSAVDSGTRRVHWVVPLSIEIGRGPTRAYGSVGYFSRGAVFASAALERHVSSRVALTGALMQSWATTDADEAEALGLRRRRTDVGGGVSAFLVPQLAVFAFAGRTISEMEFDSSRFVFSFGLALGFHAPRQTLPRPPR